MKDLEGRGFHYYIGGGTRGEQSNKVQSSKGQGAGRVQTDDKETNEEGGGRGKGQRTNGVSGYTEPSR